MKTIETEKYSTLADSDDTSYPQIMYMYNLCDGLVVAKIYGVDHNDCESEVAEIFNGEEIAGTYCSAMDCCNGHEYVAGFNQ